MSVSTSFDLTSWPILGFSSHCHSCQFGSISGSSGCVWRKQAKEWCSSSTQTSRPWRPETSTPCTTRSGCISSPAFSTRTTSRLSSNKTGQMYSFFIPKFKIYSFFAQENSELEYLYQNGSHDGAVLATTPILDSSETSFHDLSRWFCWN